MAQMKLNDEEEITQKNPDRCSPDVILGPWNFPLSIEQIFLMFKIPISVYIPAPIPLFDPFCLCLQLAGGGMAKETTFKALGRRGLLPLQPDVGMKLLMNAIAHPSNPVVTACPMDVARLQDTPYYGFLRRAGGKTPAACDDRTGHVAKLESAWLAELRGMDLSMRREGIRHKVEEVVAGLGLENVARTTVWGEAGLDSLGMVEVRNGVVRAFEGAVPLGATALFDYPTLNALVQHIEATLCPSEVGGGVERPSMAAAVSLAGEAVAVVGMACRFPGGGDGPEAFWRMLVGGVDSAMEIPITRMDWRSLFVPDGAPGSLYTNRAALLDAGPFNSPTHVAPYFFSAALVVPHAGFIFFSKDWFSSG